MRVGSVGKILRAAVAVLAGWLGLGSHGVTSGQAAAEVPRENSAAFERFRFAFFEDRDSPRNGLDLAALAALQGEERTRAEDMLIQYLPDSRGVIGLGVLRSRRAGPLLQALFEAEQQERLRSQLEPGYLWFPHSLIYIAKALWQIRPDPRWSAALIDVLGSDPDDTTRETAAQELFEVRDDATAQALTKALDDPEQLVRYHAARALLAIYGLPADPGGLEDKLYRLMSKDPARRDSGKQDILTAIAGRPMLAP